MLLLLRLLDIYSIVVFVAVVVSWMRLSDDNPLARISRALTEPLLAPIRKVLPSLGGLDFSPLVLLFALQAVRRLIGG